MTSLQPAVHPEVLHGPSVHSSSTSTPGPALPGGQAQEGWGRGTEGTHTGHRSPGDRLRVTALEATCPKATPGQDDKSTPAPLWPGSVSLLESSHPHKGQHAMGPSRVQAKGRRVLGGREGGRGREQTREARGSVYRATGPWRPLLSSCYTLGQRLSPREHDAHTQQCCDSSAHP